MAGIEQLRPDNHALYLRVQKLLNMRWTYDAICDDAGLVGPRRVQELCKWFIAYRSPKPLPTVITKTVHDIPVPSRSYTRDGQRFLAWRKQRMGARKALEDAGL